MVKTINIIEGHFNELFNKEEDLYNNRIAVCKECPLYKIDSILGEICNGKLYIDPKTNKISNYPKIGYIKGCNCRLGAKTRMENEQCIINKW